MMSTEKPPDEPERPRHPDDPDAEAEDRGDELDELQRQLDVAHDSPPPPARGEL